MVCGISLTYLILLISPLPSGPTLPPDPPCPPGASGISVSQDLQEYPAPPLPSGSPPVSLPSPGLPGPKVPPGSAGFPGSPGLLEPEVPLGTPLPSGSPGLSESAAPPDTPSPPGPSGLLVSPGTPVVSYPARQRQERTFYNSDQVGLLEKVFQRTKYPNYQERVALAEKINVQDHQVQVWFKNRRAKLSRQKLQQSAQPFPRPQGYRSLAAPSRRVPPGQVHGPMHGLACSPGFLALPSRAGVLANRHLSSYSQALADPVWDAQECTMAGSPAGWPQTPDALDVKSEPELLPGFNEVLAPRNPFREYLGPAKTPEYPSWDDFEDKDKLWPRHY
ncbi:homeobox protein goosecoid-like [Ictidomys tridecemlineatus]|nr:homeobox protein goosecoid-like [Ictidomys tridecemlineatus]